MVFSIQMTEEIELGITLKYKIDILCLTVPNFGTAISSHKLIHINFFKIFTQPFDISMRVCFFRYIIDLMSGHKF